jgi:integrase
VEVVGTADDFSDADGNAVLNWSHAQKRAREAMVANRTPSGSKGRLTVRRAVEEYVEFLEHERESADDARYRAEAFIYPALGEIELDKLSTKTVRDWLRSVAKTPPRLRTAKGEEQRFRKIGTDVEATRRRRSSANRTLTVLKAALNRQWRDGNVASDAAWRRVEPFESVDAARVRYLSIAEAKRLINASEPDFRALVQGALHTGARYGELARLEVADFNTDSETLAIRRSKSGKPRHVELTEEGAQFFRQHCAGRAGSERMFLKTNGTVWGKSHQERPIKKANARAKIAPPIKFHELRHTYCSHAVMNGVSTLVVAKTLGHSDTRMVEKHYGHLAPSYLREAIRAGAPQFGVVNEGKVRPLRGRR